MDYIQSSNKQIDKFGPGAHGFSAGNPTGGTPATFFTPDWSDGVQQEIINAIKAAGLVPTGAALTQLTQAIKRIAGGNVTTVNFAASPFSVSADHAGLILVDATAGHVVLNLPAVNVIARKLDFKFVRADATANTATGNCAGADTFVGGAVSFTLTGQGDYRCIAGNAGALWAITGEKPAAPVVPALRGYLAGLTLSTAGASATASVSAGSAVDSTNSVMMTLVAAIAKTTAAWAVGTAAGGLDTGAIANSTWYHVHLIRRPDTGAVDVLFSLSVGAPTLPANYTQFRRIGSILTTGAALWTKFIQDGDLFQWDVPAADVYNVNPGTAAVTRTLSTPLGVNTRALVAPHIAVGSSAVGQAYFSDLAVADTAPSGVAVNMVSQRAGGENAVPMILRTNTSSQIRSRLSYSDGDVQLRISTYGWLDTRGKEA